jgi:hypothetical protein
MIMPIELPRLDDRTWEDLVEEGRSMIPGLAPAWTNHNASDPGITLIELFAYFTESFIYRTNRITEANILAFLRLLRGPGWTPGNDRGRDVRETLAGVRRCHRAVSPRDFETIALSVNDLLPADAEKVGRVQCLPRRNLSSGRGAVSADAPGHVTVLILPDRRAMPSIALLREVSRILEPARVITTRVHVLPPRFVTVGVRITLTPERGYSTEIVRADALKALERFFDPMDNGPDRAGWPFGRDVYVSEIYQLLSRVPGVRMVSRTAAPPGGRLLDELVVAPAEGARLRYNSARELEAVVLDPDELVSVWLDPVDITVVSGSL